MSRTVWRTISISLILSTLGVLAVVLLTGGLEDLQQLAQVSWLALLGALGLLGASFWVGGLRLKGALGLAGAKVNIASGVRAYILGLFGGAVTPAGSGSAPMIALALQREGVKPTLAWSASVYASILDLFYFAYAIPVSALLLWRADLLPQLWLWLALPLSLGSLLFWYGLAFELARLKRLVGTLLSIRFLRRWRRQAMRLLLDVSRALGSMARGSPWLQLQLHGNSLLLHTVMYTILYLFASALGGRPEFLHVQAALVLVTAGGHLIPTPGGSGYQEVMMSYLLSQQLSTNVVTSAVVAYRAVSFYTAILVGGLLGSAVFMRTAQKTAGHPEAASRERLQPPER
jgi:uncharacterized protein (TIRG00374 family)